jgi:hypothetical protein
MLDRIDSLLLTIPVIYLYLMLLKELASWKFIKKERSF